MKKLILLFVAVTVVFAICIIKLFYSIPENSNSREVVVLESKIEDTSIIKVPTISQYPELPTGCETVAAVMVLKYYGSDITPCYFAENWLKCDSLFYTFEGKDYGPDPYKVFAGNPFSESSYGCFSTPIADAVNFNTEEYRARTITDKSLDELCTEYIDNGKPLLVWATMGMKESKKGRTWYLKDGSLFTWTAGEHCLVLVGYNEEYYFLNDPQTGSTVAYEKILVKKRYEELGKQAVYISKV